MPVEDVSKAASRPQQRWSTLARALWFVVAALPAGSGDAQEAGTAVYVRTDSDKTTVVSPRLRVATPVGDATRIGLVYTLDIWTSASIDIRSSASKAITEQRDELDFNVSHSIDDVNLSGVYRFSKEPDYESHAGTVGVSYDFAARSATLALGASASFDTVGRAGDPWFSRALRTLSGRATFTQVLDPKTLVQALYELIEAEGYLSSPYRFVGIGGSSGFCTGSVMFCIPEENPGKRLRHVLALRARRALSAVFSAGAGYRFYTDDWGLSSHTAELELSLLPETETVLSLRYRFYAQGAASHYRSRYEMADGKFYTNDKELSPFTSHRVALDLEHAWQLDGRKLRTILSLAPSLYRYSDFTPLTQIRALEVTLATVFEL